MLDILRNLFTPSEKLAQERLVEFELELDAIAKDQGTRFSRGNAASQMGLVETEEELDVKREITIARYA